MVAQMETVDRQLLNIIQTEFPLEPEPYKAIGRQLDISGEEVIQRLGTLKKQNILRQVSAIFDTRRLGYKTCLVAMRLPQETLTKAAHLINEHPGVSHNYARKGYFNLWYTIAVPPTEILEETVERMARETNAESVRLMPTIRFFKIGVNFDMMSGESAAHSYYSPDGYKDGEKAWNKVESVTDFEIETIRELQEDLPLIPRPFVDMAKRLGITEEGLFSHAQAFQKRGIMRRYSAVLHHRRAGFKANGMGVWKVPSERSEEVGRIMAANPAVTHCYERPTFPDWPYTHFSMIHASTKDGCDRIAAQISVETGITDYKVLYSYREYKKTRVRYFV